MTNNQLDIIERETAPIHVATNKSLHEIDINSTQPANGYATRTDRVRHDLLDTMKMTDGLWVSYCATCDWESELMLSEEGCELMHHAHSINETNKGE